MAISATKVRIVFYILIAEALLIACGAADYYQLLGVSKSATTRDIKKSFRKLALKYHPDHNKEKDAEARFRELVQAYEILTDDEKRRRYDQLGPSAFDGTGEARGGGGGGGFNRNDFFHNFEQSFNAHGRRSGGDGAGGGGSPGGFKFKFGHHTFDFDDFWSDFHGDDFQSFFMPHQHHDGGGGGGFGGGPSIFGHMAGNMFNGFDHMAHAGAHYMGDLFGMGDRAAHYYDEYVSPYVNQQQHQQHLHHQQQHRNQHYNSHFASHHSSTGGSSNNEGQNCRTETRREGSQVITTTVCS